MIAGVRRIDRIPRRSRCQPDIAGKVVAPANAARWETEPIAKYASAVVGWVVSEQPVQTILLLASATRTAKHLLIFEP